MSKKKQKPKDTKSPLAGPKGKPAEAEAAAGDELTAAEEPSRDAKGEGKSGWATGELEALKEENKELKDRLLRTVAEMENVRRRTERDKQDTAKYAISNFARDVLTVADNIALAIGHVPEEAAEKDSALKNFRDGIIVTERELLNLMERHGITRVEPIGERFDPNQHQAMFEVDNKDVEEGTILEVIQAGYVIADRVLRPAMVGVAKGGAKPEKPAVAKDTPNAANDDEPGGEGAGIGSQIDESA
ncbi:MAG: nucleotide exchange factor GrpE [Hyphomicrobiales bacterium]|nr:nucleotide exchange factor GrpE [Hyphomicrobiales bacterium]